MIHLFGEIAQGGGIEAPPPKPDSLEAALAALHREFEALPEDRMVGLGALALAIIGVLNAPIPDAAPQVRKDRAALLDMAKEAYAVAKTVKEPRAMLEAATLIYNAMPGV